MSHTLNIPMIDLPRVHQPYQQELDVAILAVVRSGQYISGSVVHNFERQVSSYLDSVGDRRQPWVTVGSRG